MSISWGKMIGGAVAITGLATLGVGLGGEALAEWLDPGTVSDAIKTAATTINETGLSAAKAVAIESISGKTAAAIAAAGATAIGAGVMAMSGKDNKDNDEDSPEVKAKKEAELLAEIKRRMIIRAEELGTTEDGRPLPPDAPSGRTSGGGREA